MFGLYGCMGSWLWSQSVPVLLPEKSISGTRFHTPIGVKDTSLWGHAFTHAWGQGLGAELARETGAYLRMQAPGLLGSFSFRGAGPERTLVVWNGIPVNGWTTGQADVNLFAITPMSRIQFAGGAATTEWGSGAVGAVINIDPFSRFGEESTWGIQTQWGSFGQKNTTAYAYFGKKGWRFHFSGHLGHAQNNFAFRNLALPQQPTQETQHASVLQGGAQWRLAKDFTRGTFTYTGAYHYAKREIPAVMGAAWNQAVQMDASLRQVLQGHYRVSRQLKIHGLLGYTMDRLDYTDASVFSPSTVHTGHAQGSVDWKPNAKWTWRGGLELQSMLAQLANYNQGNANETRFALHSSLRYKGWIEGEVQVRQPWVTGFTTRPVASLGLQKKFFVAPDHRLSVHGQAATHFRIPTLNDRFWTPGGNAALRPETGWQTELGMTWEFGPGAWKQTFQAQGYYSRIDDFIRWIPTNSGYWSPENITQVGLYGFELHTNTQWKWRKMSFNIHARGQWNRTEDRAQNHRPLPYTPEFTAFAGFQMKWKTLEWSVQCEAYSLRYTQADLNHQLPAFALVHTMIKGEWKKKRWAWSPFIRVENLTQTQYQWLRNRPMPGQTFLMGLQLSWLHARPREVEIMGHTK